MSIEKNEESDQRSLRSAVTGAVMQALTWREAAVCPTRQMLRSSVFPAPAVSIRCSS